MTDPDDAVAVRPRVLVVDDDERLLRAHARILAQHYQVDTALDAAGALRALRDRGFDVLVSDIHMGAISGLELVATLKAEGFDVPVVLMTGQPDLETAIKALEYGVLRYVQKPVVAATLLSTVGEVVRLHGMARIDRLALDNEALRSLVDELQRAKLAAKAGTRAKNEFLSKMGHELRTPMSTVLGMTDMLLGSELTEDQRANLEAVRQAAEGLMDVIAHVLDVADLAGGRLQLEGQPFSVRALLEEVAARRRPAAEARGLALALAGGADVPDLLIGDRARVAQVVDLLLDNAVKFTARGEVTIRADLEPGAAPTQARVRISVADTGVGIPGDALARVLEAFVQGDDSSTRPYAGAGLGLTIAAQLAALMKGTLGIESVVDVGTTVRFTVDLARPPVDDGFFHVDAFPA